MEDKELLAHLKQLGLASVADYQRWCKAHGFSSGLNKTYAMRAKEVQFLKELSVQQAFAQGRNKHKPLGKKIQHLLEQDSISLKEIQDPRIKGFFEAQKDKINSQDYRKLLSFLQVLDKKSKLLDNANLEFTSAYRHNGHNRILDGLFLIFLNYEKRLQSLENWKCDTKNAFRQFSSLLRYLFAQYPLPTFLDSAWFSNNPQEVIWWFLIARGQNIRKAEQLPITLTKKQAHCFLQSPDHFTISQALRYGQIMGLCEDRRLVDAVLTSSLGRGFHNDEFWFSVIYMFINNPMLDRAQLSPMVDYINAQKFNPGAPHPGFSMKGRNVNTLLDEVETWHSKISKERGKGYMEWKSCGLPAFSHTETIKNQPRIWSITELTNSKLLGDEGRAMHHCVASYKYSASSGKCSIWSLKCDGERLVTLEVSNNSAIVQARGRYNAIPQGKSLDMIRQWAHQVGLGINSYGI